MLVRLQKHLAEAGIASRRGSEQIILEGRVTVNGGVIRELGSKIDPVQDRITVDGLPVKSKRKLYIALNKPDGYICSRHDPLSRPAAADLLPKEWSNLYSVGRLDYNSEGLIFFTNDGEFSLRLTHPRYGVRKKYMVTVKGLVEDSILKSLVKGMWQEGERLKAEKARVIKGNASFSLIEVILSEGKNREIRRLFEAQGLEVERLQRTQIGPIKLGELRKGKWRTLTESEIKSLLLKSTAEGPTRS